MNDKKKPTDAVLPDEQDLRRGRKFSLAEALGRENADMLKGASPVARGRQVLLELEQFLETYLRDPDGSLVRTLVARLEDNPPLVARHFERPLGALVELVNQVLATDQTLVVLVRDTDARWGREYQEKPRFEKDGASPVPDDPYTRAGVREQLESLLAHLENAPDPDHSGE
jgi:hypothetical protein